MPIVVGITLRTAGKIYYFDPGTEHYLRDERVLVETARGPEIGTVKQPPFEVGDDQIVPPLKQVIRRVTKADHARETYNREREANALEACKRLVTKFNLPMRLIDAQYTFDSSHVLIHFLADNRIDFRELVRELAHELHTRIELRQVGVRDEARLLGGYGMCGRTLCCASFLSNFAPVAIGLAKEQGLALNPQKISGMCGRLMCCLTYEHECYKEFSAELPHLNATVETPRGTGKVTKLNVLSQQIEVAITDLPGPIWFTLEELRGGTKTEPAPLASESRCSGCARKHGQQSDFPEVKLNYAESDESSVEEVAATASVEGESPAKRRRRPRRRSKRPSEGAPQPAGTAREQQPAASPRAQQPKAPRQQQPAAAPATADGQPAAPAKPRRPRKRRAPRKEQPAVPVAVSAQPERPVQSDPAKPAIPPGQYRPRRRR